MPALPPCPMIEVERVRDYDRNSTVLPDGKITRLMRCPLQTSRTGG